jgi:hypothetical protein
VALLFFASTLRARLRAAGWEPLATTAFGGAVVMAVALGIFGAFQIALVDASDLGQEQVAQTLNIIDNDNFLPAVIGIAAMYLATGWHCLRSGVLPKWLAVGVARPRRAQLRRPSGIPRFRVVPDLGTHREHRPSTCAKAGSKPGHSDRPQPL